MKKPEIEVVRFGAEDVIATSGAPKLVTWENLGGTKGDSIVSFGDNTFASHSTYQASDIRDALKSYYGWSGSPSTASVYFSIDEGKSRKTLSNLWDDDPYWQISTDYNTTYRFEELNSSYWFYKQ